MKKTKKGFLLPDDLISEFEVVASRLGGKEKWVVLAASFLMFMESADERQNDYIDQVRRTESPGRSMKALLAEAKKRRDGNGVISGGRVSFTNAATESSGNENTRSPEPAPEAAPEAARREVSQPARSGGRRKQRAK